MDSSRCAGALNCLLILTRKKSHLISSCVLGLCDSLDLAIQGRAPTACALMRTIVADGALNALLREGLQTYRARCVIHGDLRSENWLRDCRSPRRELRLLDWEIAGAGDPLWDLGSLLAETVGHHIRCNHPVDAIWPPLCHATLSQILRSYAAANGPIDLADSDVWRRLAVMAAARLLHVATECAEQGAEPGDWPVAALLQAASAVAGDPNGAGAGLARLVSPR